MDDKHNLVLIVGAMKAGTTSLFKMLSQHPEILPTNRKETHFFNKNYDKGIAFYNSFWPEIETDTRFLLESTPAYSQCHIHENVPERIYRHYPNAKIIYIVRDRLDRIESMFRQYVNDTNDTRNINEHLPQFIVDTSNYYYQISRFTHVFDKKQIFLMTTESLELNPELCLSRLCDWLGVENITFQNGAIKYGDSRVTNTFAYQTLRKVRLLKVLSTLLSQRSKYAIITWLSSSERIKESQFQLSSKKRQELLLYFKNDMALLKSEFNIEA